MRIKRISKGGGRFRTIYCPNQKEKQRLRDLLPGLNDIHTAAVEAAGTRGVAHAFIANRNPVTCALPHRGFQVTVSCDLENWFDTVREDQLVAAGVPPEVAKAITIDGVCRQGLPTSPVAANIAAVAMDKEILAALASAKGMYDFVDFVYTRYADDITISFSFTDDGMHHEEVYAEMVVRIIRNRAANQGWTISERKTHIQNAKAGRRIIVGIAVTARVQATRETRRKLRAATHQAAGARLVKSPTKGTRLVYNPMARNSALGLTEWAACKLPRRVRSNRQMMGVLAGSGPVAATPQAQVTSTVSTGDGRRVLVPVREKISEVRGETE